MTSRDEPFERTLRSWMTGEASQEGADVIQAAAIGEARRRHQRPTLLVAITGTTWDRARGARRSGPSPRILVLIAILVVIAAGLGVAGSGVFRSDRGLSVVLPSTSPSASASTSPTSTPRTTPRVDGPAPIPTWAPLDGSIVTYLEGHGQDVKPVAGAVPDDFAYAALRKTMPPGFPSGEYYVLVTCVDPTKGCAEVGSAGVGDQRGIWFMYGSGVRAVDAVTLEPILINGY